MLEHSFYYTIPTQSSLTAFFLNRVLIIFLEIFVLGIDLCRASGVVAYFESHNCFEYLLKKLCTGNLKDCVVNKFPTFSTNVKSTYFEPLRDQKACSDREYSSSAEIPERDCFFKMILATMNKFRRGYFFV